MTAAVLSVVLLLCAAGAIYLACEVFVNGIEWVGRSLSVGSTATGTILAAFGTALPESVITFIAVAFGHTDAQRDLGVGAALGGPLALATVAYPVVGLTLILTGQTLVPSASRDRLFARLSRDQGAFLAIFAVKLAAGLVAFALKPWLGVLFLAAYAIYFWTEMSREETEESADALDPLLLARQTPNPHWALSVGQTVAALAVIFGASRLFVSQLDGLAPLLGVRPQLLSLLASPVATELPETLNAIIWVRQGKLKLALANISGAMMIQATVPTAFGLFYTPWHLDAPLLLAGTLTLLTIAGLFLAFRQGVVTRGLLTATGLVYGVFCLGLAVLHL